MINRRICCINRDIGGEIARPTLRKKRPIYCSVIIILSLDNKIAKTNHCGDEAFCQKGLAEAFEEKLWL